MTFPMGSNFKKYFILLLWSVMTTTLVWSQATMKDDDIVNIPSPPRLVNDFAGMLNAQETAALESKLVGYSDTTSTQIAVVTVPTIGEYPVEEYGIRLARKWGIGEKGKDNGILILIAQKERKFDIQTGYRIGQYVSDIDANRILRESLRPAFLQGQYYQGLDEATTKMMQLLSGGFSADAKKSDSMGMGKIFLLIFVLLILFIYISSKAEKHHTYTGKGHKGYSPPPFIGGGFGGFGGGGFGGGSSGGGGFGGFGGGGFGGGGASGDW